MFEPYTFGYEWEAWLLRPNLMPCDLKDVEWMADTIRQKLPWSRAGRDRSREFGCWLLELRSGIMKSWNQLLNRTEALLEVVRQLCKERDRVFFPCGCHPAFGGAVGLHTHIGSVHSYGVSTGFANLMSTYVPAFAALMANSPIWGAESGEFKSYRVQKNAEWCSMPRRVVDPGLAQWGWGEDVCVKIGAKPTLEIRIGDCASSPRLVNEYVALGVGLFFALSERSRMKRLTPGDYVESLINRWRAAKYGLQAVFVMNGKPVSVCEILEGILRTAEPGLAKIGTKASELELIQLMLEKRQTQADFQRLVFGDRKDPHSFSAELVNILGRGDPFREYLKLAQPLSPVEPMEIDDYLLSKIEIDTPYHYLHDLLGLPFAVLEEKLARLEADGKIRVKKTPEQGALYSRRPRRRQRRST